MKVLHVYPSSGIISTTLIIHISSMKGNTCIESNMGIITDTCTCINKLHNMSLIVFALIQNLYFKDLNSLL